MKDPLAFANEWCNAWNSHDLDRVLAHFHGDVVFTSPVAAKLIPGSDGHVRGKPALRAYWTEGLRQIPDLHFTIEQVFSRVDTLVIHYRNQNGVAVSEVLIFEAGKVRYGYGTYPVNVDNPAGAQRDPR